MKKSQVILSREYVVEICAENEQLAGEFTELYVSGGFDDSKKFSRENHNFEIISIKPLVNESSYIEEIF